jgi:hypothetical protein
MQSFVSNAEHVGLGGEFSALVPDMLRKSQPPA